MTTSLVSGGASAGASAGIAKPSQLRTRTGGREASFILVQHPLEEDADGLCDRSSTLQARHSCLVDTDLGAKLALRPAVAFTVRFNPVLERHAGMLCTTHSALSMPDA